MLNTGNTRKKFPKKVNIPFPTKQTPTHLDLEIKNLDIINLENLLLHPPYLLKALDLNTKLGKHRKLTSEKCQRHLDKKLCLFYGRYGHTASDCTKSTSHAAKGHAAMVAPETKQEASSEVKIVHNLPDSAWDEGHVDSTHALELRLNAVALSNLTSHCPYVSLLSYPNISLFYRN
jgi:hypothetical protein